MTFGGHGDWVVKRKTICQAVIIAATAAVLALGVWYVASSHLGVEEPPRERFPLPASSGEHITDAIGVENDLGMRLPSPSGRYVLRVSVSGESKDELRVTFRLHDSKSNLLDIFRTDVSAKGRWTAGWAPGEDYIILPHDIPAPRDIGVAVYIISRAGKLASMEMPPPKYGDAGFRLMDLKYPERKQEDAEPADGE